MTLRAIALAVFVASATCGCVMKPVDEQELIGRYQASLPDGGTESLELRKGGECAQVIHLRNGATYQADGSWKLWFHRNRPRLLFKGLRRSVTATHEINPEIAKPPFAAIGTSVWRDFSGNIIINLTEDTYYRKK
jgi:hypothetical protein